ncbi:MAG: hypothetical protein EOP00_18570 [Pedobacter sp.]|nr:MAG: hypothetical protein EOP00_18570 [Pedobacter sp.]
MKTLLIIGILSVAALILILLNIDFVSSIIPGWQTNILPSYILYIPAILLNLIFPVLIFIKFKQRIKPYIIVVYFATVNLIFLISKIMYRSIIYPGSVTIEQLKSYVNWIPLLVIGTLTIHVGFYIFLYLKVKNK